MKQYPFPETGKNKMLFGIFFTLLLYLCRDSMYTTALLGFNRAYALTVVLVGIVGIAFLVQNRKKWKAILCDRRMAVLVVVTAALLLPMLLKRDWQMMYISILFCLFIGILLSYFIPLATAAKYYVGILSAVGVYSMLATYLLRMLPDRGILQVPVFSNAIGYLFHNFGFAIVSDDYVKMRNFGIFREPGVYQYFVLLGLYLNNYHVCWKKARNLWICNGLLALTMLSTIATGGIVELMLLAAAVFFHKKLYRSKTAMIWILVLVILASLGMAWIVVQQGELYWTIYGSFVSKFQPSEDDDGDSVTDRLDTILENTRCFLRHPILGGKIGEIFDAVANNTSSSTLLFAIFGILGGVLHVVSWAALVWDRKNGISGNLFLLLILFMAFNTQNLIANVFLWLFPIMALCQRELPQREKRA